MTRGLATLIRPTRKKPALGGLSVRWPELLGGWRVFLGDHPLLADRQDVVDDPVQYQARREEEEHHRECQRHEQHHLRLHRIGRSRVQLGRDKHRDRVQHWQDAPWVMLGQVGDPAYPWRAADFHRRVQHPVQGDKDGHLDQNRQAAAQRIDLFSLVQLHRGLVHLLRIAFIAFADRLHLRRDEFQLGHAAITGSRQWEESQFDQDGEGDNRPAPVTQYGMDMFHDPEDRLGDNRQPAIILDQFQARRDWFQQMGDLRARVQFAVQRSRGARRQRWQGYHVADGVQIGRQFLGEDIARNICRWYEGRNKEVLRNRKPAAIRFLRMQALHGRVRAFFLIFQSRFFDFLERQLLVFVIWRVQGRTRVAAVEEGIGDRFVAVMNQLHVQLWRDWRSAHVRNTIVHIDHIIAALEGERLGQLDAALHRFHHQLNLLAVTQRAHAWLYRETGVMRRERTAYQARLRHIGMVPIFVEQHFIFLTSVRLASLEQAEAAAKPARIARALEFQQFQTLDLGTQRVDIDLDDIGGDGNALALESGRISAIARRACGHAAGCRQNGRGWGNGGLRGLFRVRGEHRRLAVRDHPFVPENYQRDGKHDPQDGTFIDIH